jgi:hypothetical protein
VTLCVTAECQAVFRIWPATCLEFSVTKVSEIGTIKPFQNGASSFTLFFLHNSKPHRKLHNEELNDLYSLPNIVRLITSRRIRWVGHVARMAERRGVYRVLVAKTEGKKPLGDPGVDGRIILRWIFRKGDVGEWTGSSWLMTGTVGGHL